MTNKKTLMMAANITAVFGVSISAATTTVLSELTTAISVAESSLPSATFGPVIDTGNNIGGSDDTASPTAIMNEIADLVAGRDQTVIKVTLATSSTTGEKTSAPSATENNASLKRKLYNYIENKGKAFAASLKKTYSDDGFEDLAAVLAAVLMRMQTIQERFHEMPRKIASVSAAKHEYEKSLTRLGECYGDEKFVYDTPEWHNWQLALIFAKQTEQNFALVFQDAMRVLKEHHDENEKIADMLEILHDTLKILPRTPKGLLETVEEAVAMAQKVRESYAEAVELVKGHMRDSGLPPFAV